MTPTNNYGCVSYPTAKALMLAGVEFETNVCYNEEGGIFSSKESGEILYLKTGKFSHIGTVDFVASPTFEDIWNELPETIRTKDEGLFCLRKDKIGYYLYGEDIAIDANGENLEVQIDVSIIEAAAKLLLLLKKHNILRQINTRPSLLKRRKSCTKQG